MKTIFRIISIISLTASIAGCGNEAPRRSSPQGVLGSAEIDANRQQVDTTPKLDVIFVIDNSLSMDRHQLNLGKNIDQFVNAFTANTMIDFHIGVITIWDSDPAHVAAVAAKHPIGRLIPLQDPDPNAPAGTPLVVNGAVPAPFVTKDTPNLAPVLARTIFLGTDPGPEFEEMFSPIESFFTPENLNGPNNGFYRPDAHLLIVVITDANDSTIKISSEGLYTFLLNVKGGQRDKIHIYSIISPVGDNSCHKDQAGPPYKFNQLTRYSDGTILSLCSPTFGQELASFGKTLSVKVGYQVIQLDRHPDKNSSMMVTYGSQTIPKAIGPNYDQGWSYDPEKEQIILGGDLKLKSEPGAKISVHFVPVDFRNIVATPATPLAPVKLAPVTAAKVSP